MPWRWFPWLHPSPKPGGVLHLELKDWDAIEAQLGPSWGNPGIKVGEPIEVRLRFWDTVAAIEAYWRLCGGCSPIGGSASTGKIQANLRQVNPFHTSSMAITFCLTLDSCMWIVWIARYCFTKRKSQVNSSSQVFFHIYFNLISSKDSLCTMSWQKIIPRVTKFGVKFPARPMEVTKADSNSF